MISSWRTFVQSTLGTLVLLSLGSLPLFSQLPSISYRGIVNAGSYLPQGLPAGGIAQGSIFSVFGANLGPSTPTQQPSFPLQTTLAGVTITVSQGATAVNAIPLYITSGQINAIMPSNAPLGMDSVQVVYRNARSNMAPVLVLSSAVGLLTVSGSGNGPGVIFNFVSQSNQPVNSLQAAAQPGQVETMWATGLGPGKGPDNQVPVQGTLPVEVEVFIGGVPAKVNYSGRSGCCAGTDQIIFTIPQNTPEGCWVPVQVRSAGTTVSNVVTMAISAHGSKCSDPANPFSQIYAAGGNLAILTLLRGATHEEKVVPAPVDITADYFVNTMTQEQGGQFVYAPFLSEPPPGTCTLFMQKGNFLTGTPLPGPRTTVKTLDYGGPPSITGPQGLLKPTDLYSGAGVGALGGMASLYSVPNTLYLNPGKYTLAGAGGADVGSFQASLTIPQPFTYTNRDQNAVIDRSQPLVINWSGAPAGQTLAVFGGTVDFPTNSTALFYCIATPGATTLTIPTYILAAIPATRPNVLQSNSALHVTNMPLSNAAPFNARGIDVGVLRYVFLTGRTVIFK